MRLLAIDTSTASGSIALLDDEELLADYSLNVSKTHAEILLPAIDDIFKRLDAGIESVDTFAVSIGPGAFTGLRVGISIIKGLAWSMKRPVIGVSTLKALAMNIPYTEKCICPILNARKGQVYTAIYRWEEDRLKVVSDDMAVTLDSMTAHIENDLLFLGDGLDVCMDLIKKISHNPIFASRSLWTIRASNVGRIALREAKRVKAEEIKPLYLREM